MKYELNKINPIILSSMLTIFLLGIGCGLFLLSPEYLEKKNLIEAAFNLCIGGATISFAYGVISTLSAKKEIATAVVSLFTGDSNIMKWLKPEARKGAVTAAFTASFGGNRGKVILDHIVGKYFSNPINFAFIFEYIVSLDEKIPIGINPNELKQLLKFGTTYGTNDYFWVTTDFKCGLQIYDPQDQKDEAKILDGYQLSMAICFDTETFESLSQSSANHEFIVMREIILDKSIKCIDLQTLRKINLKRIVDGHFKLKIWDLDPVNLRQNNEIMINIIPKEINGKTYISAQFKLPNIGQRLAAIRIRLSFPQKKEHRYFICSMPWPTKSPYIDVTGLPGTDLTCIPLTSSLDQKEYEIIKTDLPDGRPNLIYRASGWHFPRSAVFFNW
jgi:hypothetical protein